jgi:hypothetical protein
MMRHQVSSLAFTNFLQKAQQLDLSPIAYQLMQSPAGPRWTKPQTVKALAQYLAFLYLSDCYPHLQLVPSLTIDQVWHYHILDTQKYAEDCQLLLGHMIHHFPYLGLRGESDRRNQQQAYTQTKRLLSQHFSHNSIEQNLLPGDCEPIQIEAISSTTDRNRGLKLRSRPQAPIDTAEVLMNIFVSLQGN